MQKVQNESYVCQFESLYETSVLILKYCSLICRKVSITNICGLRLFGVSTVKKRTSILSIPQILHQKALSTNRLTMEVVVCHGTSAQALQSFFAVIVSISRSSLEACWFPTMSVYVHSIDTPKTPITVENES